MKFIYQIVFVSVFILIPLESLASDEVITFKDGQRVEGEIVDKTDMRIKVDVQGVIITYDLDEIESIEKKEESPTVDIVDNSAEAENEVEEIVEENSIVHEAPAVENPVQGDTAANLANTNLDPSLPVPPQGLGKRPLPKKGEYFSMADRIKDEKELLQKMQQEGTRKAPDLLREKRVPGE